MIKKSNNPILAAAILLQLSACQDPAPVQLSEKPAQSTTVAAASAQTSRFSTRARVNMQDLVTLAESEIPSDFSASDQKRVCKKVLGLKLCGNARWNYTVQRQGQPSISGQGSEVLLSVPMRFFGNAGLGGDVSKVLNLDKLDFAGALNATLRLELDLNDQWCPQVKSQADYEWTQTPKLNWTAGIDFNLEDKLDEAIAEQLSNLQNVVDDAIDCTAFRNELENHWQAHNIELDIPHLGPMFLNVNPKAFAFSGIRTEQEKIGLAFALDAQTTLAPNVLETAKTALPTLKRTPFEPGHTRFDLLIRVGYDKLQALAAAQIENKTFTEQSAAGAVSVTVNELTLYGSNEALTIGLGFDAKLPGSKKLTPGTAYLQSRPTIETTNKSIVLNDIKLTNAIDNTLWNTLLGVFKKKIIAEIEKNAVWNFSDQIIEIQKELLAQLNNTQITGGLNVKANFIRIRPQKLVPEENTLAAVLRVETALDIELPLDFLKSIK